IAPSGVVTIAFRVTIDPLPAGVTSVVNQGTVASDMLPTLSTDDPAVGGNSDPTVTVVTATARLRAEKTAVLGSDNDFDGVPSPGDRLDYQVVIVNAGNVALSGVVFDDLPDPNTALVNG